MGQKHLLDCDHCDQKIEIEPKNAGNQCVCSHCGKSTRAPKMREIQLLPMAGGHPEAKRDQSAGRSSLTTRWLFLVGLLTFLVFGIVAGILFYQAGQLDIEKPEYALSEKDKEVLEQMDIMALAQTWKFYKDFDLNNWVEHKSVTNLRHYNAYQRWMYICIGIAVGGLLVMIGSVFVGKRS